MKKCKMSTKDQLPREILSYKIQSKNSGILNDGLNDSY
jgi:hypothetical protein